jgi:hypothetical protein
LSASSKVCALKSVRSKRIFSILKDSILIFCSDETPLPGLVLPVSLQDSILKSLVGSFWVAVGYVNFPPIA